MIRNYPMIRSETIETEFGIPKGQLLPHAFQKKLLQPAITGSISDETWRELIVNELSKLIAPEIARKAITKWSDFPGQLDIDVLNYLKLNCKNYSITMLTNVTSKFNSDLKRLGISDSFDRILNTCEIGYAKPDKKSFEFVLQKLNCRPEDVFFIDDRIENTFAADSLGMQTHLFQPVDLSSSKFLPKLPKPLKMHKAHTAKVRQVYNGPNVDSNFRAVAILIDISPFGRALGKFYFNATIRNSKAAFRKTSLNRY